MLLGTDLLPKLGFSLIENNKATDLLTGLSHKPRETSDTSVGQDSKQFLLHKEAAVSSVRVTVHLLNTVKVPGSHYRTVEVQTDNTEVSPCCLALGRTKRTGLVSWLQVA